MLTPLKITLPLVLSFKPSIVLPVVDLPQPDSPTIARVSPLTTSNDTLSTAFTYFFSLLNNI